jgi:hypothetical protein
VQEAAASYVAGAAIQALAIPFLWLARRERAPSDPMSEESVARERVA